MNQDQFSEILTLDVTRIMSQFDEEVASVERDLINMLVPPTSKVTYTSTYEKARLARKYANRVSQQEKVQKAIMLLYRYA